MVQACCLSWLHPLNTFQLKGYSVSNDPFQPPSGFDPSMGSREAALQKVRTPAMMLLITGIISILGAIGVVVFAMVFPGILDGMITTMQNDPNVPAEQIEQLQLQAQAMRGTMVLNFISAAVGIVGSIVMIIGANKMKNLTSYGLAMAGCIVAIVPFTSPCCGCIFPVAIGIWGIVALADQNVKSHFS